MSKIYFNANIMPAQMGNNTGEPCGTHVISIFANEMVLQLLMEKYEIIAWSFRALVKFDTYKLFHTHWNAYKSIMKQLIFVFFFLVGFFMDFFFFLNFLFDFLFCFFFMLLPHFHLIFYTFLLIWNWSHSKILGLEIT